MRNNLDDVPNQTAEALLFLLLGIDYYIIIIIANMPVLRYGLIFLIIFGRFVISLTMEA